MSRFRLQSGIQKEFARSPGGGNQDRRGRGGRGVFDRAAGHRWEFALSRGRGGELRESGEGTIIARREVNRAIRTTELEIRM